MIPASPSSHRNVRLSGNGYRIREDYEKFQVESRTYGILKLLEEKSSLDVAKSADDLLPSTNLLLGYKVAGEDWGIDNNDRMVFVGLSVEWPFLDKVDRAGARDIEN